MLSRRDLLINSGVAGAMVLNLAPAIINKSVIGFTSERFVVRLYDSVIQEQLAAHGLFVSDTDRKNWSEHCSNRLTDEPHKDLDELIEVDSFLCAEIKAFCDHARRLFNSVPNLTKMGRSFHDFGPDCIVLFWPNPNFRKAV